jgi:hypothetical protein
MTILKNANGKEPASRWRLPEKAEWRAAAFIVRYRVNQLFRGADGPLQAGQKDNWWRAGIRAAQNARI